MTSGPIAQERLEANLRLLQKYGGLSDTSIAALRAVLENPSLVLMAVPKDSVVWITGLLELDVRSPNETKN